MSKNFRWTVSAINDLKQTTKSTLAAIEDPKEKKKVILLEIESLARSPSPESQAKQLIFYLSLLNLHLFHSLLTEKELNHVSEMCHNILKLNGIKPISSRLSFLYGELHTVLSMVHLNKGETLEAVWDQTIANHLSGKVAIGGEIFQDVNVAQNLMRLGQYKPASEKLQAHVKSESPWQGKINVLLLKNLRMQQCDQQFQDHLSFIDHQFSDEIQLEIEWEKACFDSRLSGSIQPILSLLRPKQSHHHPTYLLEGMLWAYASFDVNHREKYPRLASINSKKGFRLKDFGYLYKSTSLLEKSYDHDYPFHHRLSFTKKILPLLPYQNSIEKELLLLGAIIRWLMISNIHTLSDIIKREYQQISLKISEGKSKDVNGLFKGFH